MSLSNRLVIAFFEGNTDWTTAKRTHSLETLRNGRIGLGMI